VRLERAGLDHPQIGDKMVAGYSPHEEPAITLGDLDQMAGMVARRAVNRALRQSWQEHHEHLQREREAAQQKGEDTGVIAALRLVLDLLNGDDASWDEVVWRCTGCWRT
jgi:hypothetical protein